MTTLMLRRSVASLLSRGASRASSDESARRRQARRASYVVSRAELAECTCPSDCERDHGND